MLAIPQQSWEKSKRYFSDEEKFELHKATVGETTVGSGFLIDENQLSQSTRAKVWFHVDPDRVFTAEKARAAC